MQDSNNNSDVTEAALAEHETAGSWATPASNGKSFNLFICFALVLFAAGHYFSYLEIERLIYTETWSLFDEMSRGERIFFISAIVIAIASAITGIFPVIAKIVVGLFLLAYGYTIFELFREASDAAQIMRGLGIDLSRSRGWGRLFELVGIGAYFLFAGMVLMLISLFIKLKSRPMSTLTEGSSKARVNATAALQSSRGFLSKFFGVVKLHMSQIKAALNAHDTAETVDALKHGTGKIKRAVSERSIGLGFDGLYETIKNSLAYVFGYAKAAFTANITGKIVVIIAALMLYVLFF